MDRECEFSSNEMQNQEAAQQQAACQPPSA
jgi:hypothetical protein